VFKYKARLVARGFQQVAGVDFHDTTLEYNPIHSCFGCTTKLGHSTTRCQNCLLNGNLEEDVYMTVSEWFENVESAGKVCKLVKALYGLKQAPRAWYSRIDDHLQKEGMLRSSVNYNLYYSIVDGKIYYFAR